MHVRWNNTPLSYSGSTEQSLFVSCLIKVGSGNYEVWGGAKKIRPFISLKKEKNHWKITLDKVCVTKLLIKLLYSIFYNKSCSIDNMGNLFNISCDIVDRKYDVYNFNFEKLLSTNTTVTGIVNNILYAIDAFGKQFKSLIN